MSLQKMYRLRDFDSSNLRDIERLNLMYYHPEVMQAKGYWVEGFDFSKIGDLHKVEDTETKGCKKLNRQTKEIMYSVVDKLDHLVGWVWFYVDNKHVLPVSVKRSLGLNLLNCKTFEVSYQKLMSSNWPLDLLAKVKYNTHLQLHKTRKGVIVAGLELALRKFKYQFRKVYGAKRKLVVYAYLTPDNLSSSKVLIRNGFNKYPRQYKYDGVMNDLWVKIV